MLVDFGSEALRLLFDGVIDEHPGQPDRRSTDLVHENQQSRRDFLIREQRNFVTFLLSEYDLRLERRHAFTDLRTGKDRRFRSKRSRGDKQQ